MELTKAAIVLEMMSKAFCRRRASEGRHSVSAWESTVPLPLLRGCRDVDVVVLFPPFVRCRLVSMQARGLADDQGGVLDGNKSGE